MREFLQPSECIDVSELFLENDLTDKTFCQTTLTRNAELFRKLCPDVSYGPDFHIYECLALKFKNLIFIIYNFVYKVTDT